MSKRGKTIERRVTIPVTEHVPPGMFARMLVTEGNIEGRPFELYASLAGGHLILVIDGRQFIMRGSDAIQEIYRQVIKEQ